MIVLIIKKKTIYIELIKIITKLVKTLRSKIFTQSQCQQLKKVVKGPTSWIIII